MRSSVHLAAFSRFCRSPVPQFPGAETDCSLSLGDACLDILAVGLQNGFFVKSSANSDFRLNSSLAIFLKDECELLFSWPVSFMPR